MSKIHKGITKNIKNKSHAQLLSDEIAEVPEKKIRPYLKNKFTQYSTNQMKE